MSSSLLELVTQPGAITTAFQPIFELEAGRCRLHAVECLSRGPRGTNLERPDVLFNYTRRKRAELVVDKACVKAALAAARSLYVQAEAPFNLTLNVHASSLGRDEDFVPFLLAEAERNAVAPTRLTVEIVEHTPTWNDATFARGLAALRRSGLRLALDDIGLGYCNYKMLLDCRPDYFKIDRYIVDGLGEDYYRRSVMESIAALAEKFGALVVAEGLEREADLEAILELGIDLIQGFLLAPPLAAAELAACPFLSGERTPFEEVRRQVGPALGGMQVG